MSDNEFKLTTVEEFEAATNRLLETGAKVGADAYQFRVKNQTPHCHRGAGGKEPGSFFVLIPEQFFSFLPVWAKARRSGSSLPGKKRNRLTFL